MPKHTFVKPNAGVRGRCRCCVVCRLSSQVITRVHIGSKLHQQLHHIHHVNSCCMVQCCLVELHWIHISTCRKLRWSHESFHLKSSEWCDEAESPHALILQLTVKSELLSPFCLCGGTISFVLQITNVDCQIFHSITKWSLASLTCSLNNEHQFCYLPFRTPILY